MLPSLITMLVFASAVANEQRITFDGGEYAFGIDLVDYDRAKQRCSDIQLQLVAIYTVKIQKFLQDTIDNHLRGKINLDDY